MFCLETYLDSTTSFDYYNLKIPSRSLSKADHPSNSKSICLTQFLLRLLDIHYLQKCINFEIGLGEKMCNFISLNKSPSQSKDILESFGDDLQLNLNSITVKNPYVIVLLGDFNAQTSTWYNQGKRRMKGRNLTV